MLDFVEGTLVRKSPTHAVVSAGGVGFSIQIPLSTHERLPRSGTVRILTHLSVSDSDMRLYGFSTEEERRVFHLLLGVGGVGPQTAIALLSGVSIREIRRAVVDQDPSPLTRAKGIGRKTAERIILELKSQVAALGEGAPPAPDSPAGVRQDAILALVSLGIPQPKAEEAVRKAMAETRAGAPPTAEELTKAALRHA